jgi:hypothetical protein
MICARMKPAVSGLEKDFPGKVTAHNVDASEPDAHEAVRGLGFRSHGLVIRSTDGRTIWKQADHTVRIESVKETLHEILGS